MKKIYLIPQMSTQEVMLSTQICSGEGPDLGDVTDPNENQGLAPGRLYI